MTARTAESTFNVALRDALLKTQARWSRSEWILAAESTGMIYGNAGARPDVLLVDHDSVPTVIESSFSPADAERDTIKRLSADGPNGDFVKTASEGLPIQRGVALAIDKRFRSMPREKIVNDLLNGGLLCYALYERTHAKKQETERWPSAGFVKGNIFDLAQFIIGTVSKQELDQTARQVADKVEQAAVMLERRLTRAQQEQVAAAVHQRSAFRGMRTAMVLWLNALLVQQRLSEQVNTREIQPLPSEAENPMNIVRQWRAILGENWQAIFEPAVGVLESADRRAPRTTRVALGLLIEGAREISRARLGLQINIGAELFPRLSEDRKEAAAFYTQPGTAELLAALTIRREDIPHGEWATIGW